MRQRFYFWWKQIVFLVGIFIFGGICEASVYAEPSSSGSQDQGKIKKPDKPAISMNAKPEDVQSLVGVSGGALWGFSKFNPSTNKSNLYVQRLDADGNKQKAPLLVRHTSGQVISLKINATSEMVWVVWISKLKESESGESTYLLAALRISPSLDTILDPIEVDHFQSTDPVLDFELLTTKTSLALLASPSGTESCTKKVDGFLQEGSCYGITLFSVSKEGKVARLSHRRIYGSGGGILSLLDLQGFAAVTAYAYQGGPVFDHHIVSYQAGVPAPKIEMKHAVLPMRKYVVGSEVVTISDQGDRGSQRGVCPWKGKRSGTCHMIRIARADGTTIPSKKSKHLFLPVLSMKNRCKENHAWTELMYQDEENTKQTLQIEPTQSGLMAEGAWVWTGQSFLVLDEKGRMQVKPCQELER